MSTIKNNMEEKMPTKELLHESIQDLSSEIKLFIKWMEEEKIKHRNINQEV